jgi:hypothetical protein
MKELFRTHDPVLLSWTTAVLKDSGIEAIVFDEHTGVLQGSIAAIEKRLMVIDDDFDAAQRIIKAYNEHND